MPEQVKLTQVEINNMVKILEPLDEWRMQDQYTGEEMVDMFNILSKCECCERHQKSHPVVDQFTEFGEKDEEKETDEYIKYKEDSVKHCDCSCRHSMRFLSRANNITDHPDYEDEDEAETEIMGSEEDEFY
jgi:hypothetical protein